MKNINREIRDEFSSRELPVIRRNAVALLDRAANCSHGLWTDLNDLIATIDGEKVCAETGNELAPPITGKEAYHQLRAIEDRIVETETETEEQ